MRFPLSLAALSAAALFAQSTDYAVAFQNWLTRQAERHWDERETAVGNMQSAAAVRERQAAVQRTLLDLIGGLPAQRTPLNPQITGGFTRPGYRVENIIFESQPGFRVTANLYLPTVGNGPYPAVIGVAGHSANGKASATYQTAFIGFARQGFAVLAIDPPGQGERSEYFDATSGASRVGIGTGEHTMAGMQCLLTGHTMARYEIWDGVRAFDYLLTRPEIDPRRIAVAGNSGGGTQAAYLAFAEPRLAAAVSSCYMTRWRELWSGPGPQDAEQVFPSFIAKKLDFGDFALAAAPKPFLMTTAIQDFFPIAGARATFKQNQRLFDLLAAGEKAGYFEYDDTHGWSKPRREAAYRFLNRWLQNRGGDAPEQSTEPEEESLLYATATGQLATAGGSETVQTLNLRYAHELARSRPAQTLEGLRKAIGYQPQEAAGHTVGETTANGIRTEKLELTVEGGLSIPALLFHPAVPAGNRAVVFVSSFGKGNDPDVLALVNAGTPVLAVDPRGMGEGYRPSGRTGYRQSYQLASKAILLGRNLIEIQAADIAGAARYLLSRPEAAGRRLSVYAKGAVGPAAIFATVFEKQITELTVERGIVSYLDFVSARIHEGLDQAVIPGILRHADLTDAYRLLGNRTVTLLSPVNPNGKPMLRAQAQQSVAGLGNVRVVLRGEGWELRRALPEWFTGLRVN